MTLFQVSALSFAAADMPAGAPGPASCYSGVRRLSGRILASIASVICLAYLVF